MDYGAGTIIEACTPGSLKRDGGPLEQDCTCVIILLYLMIVVYIKQCILVMHERKKTIPPSPGRVAAAIIVTNTVI